MSYPKNYGLSYGWHNTLALQSGHPHPDAQSTGSSSSGVSSLYPSMTGLNLSYGFAPGVVVPPKAPIAGVYPTLGFIDNSQITSGHKNMGWKRAESISGAGLEEIPVTAVKITDAHAQIRGLLRGAGQKLITAAGEAAKEAIGNMINEQFFKKEAETRRVLPSLKNMKVLGERGSGYRSRTDIQDFSAIVNQCIQSGNLFEDPDFPAEDGSLQFSRRMDRRVEWLRPMELSDDPQFFVEGFSRFDVQQGELGDCWLLAATANLTMDSKLFSRVVPDDQTFEDNYAGVFHFRFWQYGRWIDVVIDDRLPTYRGKLLYMHSAESNEFWSALLEKAYAKLHGSYEALKGGTTCEAMEDYTGGVTEMYELKEAPAQLHNILMKAYERNSMIACSIEPDPSVLEAETPEGLIKGHAYSVTKVELMDIVTPNSTGKIQMIRLRNPWGNEAEWTGPWSDSSPEWRYIPEHVKQNIGLTFDHDGEFWMSYRDFLTHFDRVEICNLSPDSLSEEQINKGKKKWEMSYFEGEWTKGVTAGGCRNNLDTFIHNPQYGITLEDPDEDDEEGMCTVIVALMQKNRRSRRNVGIDCLTIGFAIYSVTERDLANKPLKKHFFQYNASVARTPAFVNLREVSCRFQLPPGHYIIVPSTFDPHEEGEFLIRVFSECKNHMEENDEQVGVGDIDRRVLDIPIPNARDRNSIGKRSIQPDAPAEYRPQDPERAAIEKLFIEIAGSDGEVDWMELKGILDRSMRDYFPQTNGYQQTYVNQVNAGQPGGEGGAGEEGGGMLAMLCASLCKDTPFASIFGAPTDQGGGGGGTTVPGGGGGGGGGGYAGGGGGGGGVGYTSGGGGGLVQSQPLLNNSVVDYSGFSKDVCRSMVAMLDVDQSGKLGFEEFRILLTDIKKWRDVFKLYDHDGSGKLSAFELRTALNSAGYHLNNRILNALAHRYGSRDGMVSFDDFIMCSIKMKTMIEIFKERDVDNTNMATFSMEDWVAKTVYS